MVGLVWPKSPGVKFLVIVFCHWLMSLCKEVLIFKKLLKIKIIGTSWVLSTSSLCFAGECWSLSALGTSFEVCWDRLRINAAGPITQRSLHAGQALASWCLSLCMCVAVCPSHKHMHTDTAMLDLNTQKAGHTSRVQETPFFFFIDFYQSIVALQYYISFRCPAKWISYKNTCCY